MAGLQRINSLTLFGNFDGTSLSITNNRRQLILRIRRLPAVNLANIMTISPNAANSGSVPNTNAGQNRLALPAVVGAAQQFQTAGNMASGVTHQNSGNPAPNSGNQNISHHANNHNVTLEVDPANISAGQLRNFLKGDTVTIYVGKNHEEYKVSKDLICFVSPFFKAAFTGNFAEGATQTMTLATDSIPAFDLLVAYLYRGTYPDERIELGRPKRKLSTVIQTLELAERFQMPAFHRAALKALSTMLTYTKVTPADLTLAFTHLASDSRAIDALMDRVAEGFVLADDDYGSSNAAFDTWTLAAAFRNVDGFDVALLRAMRRLAIAKSEFMNFDEADRYIRMMTG